MTAIRNLVMVLAVVAAPWIGKTAFADDDRHQRSSVGQPVPAPRLATKLETDDVVRQRMENIRQILAANLAGIQQDRLASADYKQIAVAVSTNVDQVIREARLTQATEAALHTIVLTDLTLSSELMRTSPKGAAQRAGALGALQSLRLYGAYFEHPGWQLPPAQ